MLLAVIVSCPLLSLSSRVQQFRISSLRRLFLLTSMYRPTRDLCSLADIIGKVGRYRYSFSSGPFQFWPQKLGGRHSGDPPTVRLFAKVGRASGRPARAVQLYTVHRYSISLTALAGSLAPPSHGCEARGVPTLKVGTTRRPRAAPLPPRHAPQ